MGYLLGIDVGTTRTAAAVSRTGSHGHPEMVTLGDHAVDIPSVIHAAPDGALLFGDAAERRALTEPDRVAREFKRRVGDPTPIPLGERSFTAEQLCALLAEHVVELVGRVEGGPPERVAVTRPASWGGHKQELVAGALAARGLTVTFLAEPQAAALHYAANERVEPGATVAVYDLGGGTFDAAVVRKEATGAAPAPFTLLGRPDGVERLGGADFDEAVVDHVREAVPQAFAELAENDPDSWTAMARLRRDCREAKEALSADTEVSIPVWLGEVRTTVRLHRSDFEDRIRPRLDESVEALRRAIASAGLAGSGPSVVLLVGGSSRVPLVSQLVSAELGRPVQVDADPKNAIAKGAVLALGPADPAALPAPTGTGPHGYAAAPGGVAAAAGDPAADDGAPPSGGTLASDPGPLPWEADEPVTERVPAGDPRTVHLGPGGQPDDGAHADPPTDRLPVVPGPYGGPPPTAAFGYPEHDAPALPPDRPLAGRSPALLIGAGGVVAALAVIGAVVFWPTDRTAGDATPELPAMSTPAPAPPPPTASPEPETEAPQTTRERPSTTARTTSERPPAPPPPPVVTTSPPGPSPTGDPDPSTDPSTPPPSSSPPPSTTSSPVPGA